MPNYPKFTAQKIDTETPARGFDKIRIGVYQQDDATSKSYLIGEYERNYATMYQTFLHVPKGDRHFALYSPFYTGTRILEITPGIGIKDIGGEERDSNGFCPKEYYVPPISQYVSEDSDFTLDGPPRDWSKILSYFPEGSYIDGGEFNTSTSRPKLNYPDGRAIRAYTEDEKSYAWVWGPLKSHEYGILSLPASHAFVGGCYWAAPDEIQYLDVSRIDEGIIKRDPQKFEMYYPDRENLTLETIISSQDADERDGMFKLLVEVDLNPATGEIFDRDGLLKRLKPSPNSNFDYKAFEEDLKKRWREQGEEIKRKVAAINGEIR